MNKKIILAASLLLSLQVAFAQETKKEETKEKKIDEVTLVKTKKAVETKISTAF